VLACVLFMKQSSDFVEKGTSVRALVGFDGEKPWSDEDSVYSEYERKIFITHLYGPLFFGFTTRFQEIIHELNNGIQVLIIRLDKVPHIDQSGVYALEEAIAELQSKGKLVLLTSVSTQPIDMLRKVGVIPNLVPDMHVFDSFTNCKNWLQKNLKEENGGIDKIIEELKEVKKAKVAYNL
jgi:SulP family sulfate permease